MSRIIALSIILFMLAQSIQAATRIGPRLQFLMKAQQNGYSAFFDLPELEKIPVTLTFEKPITSEVLEILETNKFQPHLIHDKPLGSQRVLVGYLSQPAENLRRFFQIPYLLEIETSWRPHRAYPLTVSREQIEANQVWHMAQPGITGKNILIADLDTGINHFHPMFFFADGDTFAWIDVNANNQFDPAADGIDYDQSGFVEPDEILKYLQVYTSSAVTNPGGYNPSLDWIYLDHNQNSERDYGPGQGFTEADPAYGEPIFITLDINGNDLLDVGELVVQLKTSKVRKVYQSNGVIRERGVDLIDNEGDSYGHGTPVSGILLGGVADVHQLAGIAPEAELLMGVNVYIPDPPFIQTMEVLAPWAATEGADVILYEDGEWIWQYMDGSSALETMIDDFSNQGIMQVVPAGNLAGGGMHISGNIGANDSSQVTMQVYQASGQQHIWGSIIWQGDSASLNFKLSIAAGAWNILPGDGSFLNIGNTQVYNFVSRSSRGTNRLDFVISATSGSLTGSFSFRLINQIGQNFAFHGYNWDDQSGWSGLTRWVGANDDGTVTWPATADQALSVAAYNPRNSQQPINSFSGRGARVEGMRLVDIAAPGSTVYSTSASNFNYAGFSAFGGTSSAGPHVAGAVALMMNLLGTPDVNLIKDAIAQSADISNLSGTFPNHTWGYGRIRILQAAQRLLSPISIARPPIPREIQLQVYPNPFNGIARLRFVADQAGPWQIHIYNPLGQRIASHLINTPTAGIYEYNINAHSWSSGLLLVVLEFDGEKRAVRKISYVK
ncbi:MAG: S8 family peptidase [bacterium]|nr:MAG: S8 family peptidase [bacterium]